MNTMSRALDRDGVMYQAGMLGLFSLFAAGLLMFGDRLTRDAIAERAAEDLLASLEQVIPASLHDNDLLADTLTLPVGGRQLHAYRALEGRQVSAVAFEVVGQGYAGDIVVLLGIDANGQILGARVLAHAETPGLGDKIEVGRDDWILDFDGRSLDDPEPSGWAVKKDGGIFDQFSGATITPRAVVAAIKRGLELFDAHRDALLAPAASTTETASLTSVTEMNR